MSLAKLRPGGLKSLVAEWSGKVGLSVIVVGLVNLGQPGDAVVMAELPLVLGWLDNDGPNVRRAAQGLIGGLSARRNAKPIVERMIGLLGGHVTSDFLVVLLDLLKKVGYPRDRPPVGLDRQGPLDALDAIWSYFGALGELCRELCECCRAVANPDELRQRVPEFLSRLGAANDNQVAAVISLPRFVALSKSLSALAFEDLADELLTTLTSRQSLIECHSRIMAVMQGHGQPSYLAMTMPHLRDVTWRMMISVPCSRSSRRFCPPASRTRRCFG
jgi:hypothetical protein